jgi:hypothetical protein
LAGRVQITRRLPETKQSRLFHFPWIMHTISLLSVGPVRLMQLVAE